MKEALLPFILLFPNPHPSLLCLSITVEKEYLQRQAMKASASILSLGRMLGFCFPSSKHQGSWAWRASVHLRVST